jgi:hypothetical protein
MSITNNIFASTNMMRFDAKVNELFAFEHEKKHNLFHEITKLFFSKNPKVSVLRDIGISQFELQLMIYGRIDGFSVDRLDEICSILRNLEDRNNDT